MSRPFYFTPRDDEVTLSRLAGVVTAFIEHDNRKQLEVERVLKSHHDSIISMQKQISHITCMLILHIRNHNCPLTAHGRVTTTPILSNHPPPGFQGHTNMQHQEVTPWTPPHHSTTSEERDEIARSPTYDSDEDDSEESEDEDSINSDDSIMRYDGFDRLFDETLAVYEKEREEKERLRNLPQQVGEDQRHPCVLHQVGSNPTGDPFMTFFGVGKEAMEKKEGSKDGNDQLEERSGEPKKESPPPPTQKNMHLPGLIRKFIDGGSVQGKFEKGESSNNQQTSRRRGGLTQVKNVWESFKKKHLGKAREENGGKASPDANNST